MAQGKCWLAQMKTVLVNKVTAIQQWWSQCSKPWSSLGLSTSRYTAGGHNLQPKSTSCCFPGVSHCFLQSMFFPSSGYSYYCTPNEWHQCLFCMDLSSVNHVCPSNSFSLVIYAYICVIYVIYMLYMLHKLTSFLLVIYVKSYISAVSLDRFSVC